MSPLKDVGNLGEKSFREPDIYEALYEIDDDIERLKVKMELQNRAKDLKCLATFNANWKEWEKKFDAVRKSMQQEKAKAKPTSENMTDFKKAPLQYKCGSYVANDEGVYKEAENGRTTVCVHPIWIESILSNIITDTQKVKLCFTKRGRYRSIVVDRSVIAKKQKITALSDLNVSVTDDTAGNLVKYLAYLEANNLNEIPEILSTSKLGWVKDPGGEGHLFLPFDGNIELDSKENFKELLDSLTTCGNESAYIKRIKDIRAKKDNVINLNLAATLSSPLIEILDVNSFVVSMWGKTGIGKTVILKLCASLFGNPNKGFIADAKTTPTALEINMDTRNSLPLLIDDLAQVSNRDAKENLGNMVYTLCSGSGKERAQANNGSISMKTHYSWRNCVITNGERALAEEGQRGGVINRVIDINVNRKLFDSQNGNELCSFLAENYGFIGRQFIDLLKGLSKEEIRQYYDLNLKRIKERSDKLGEPKEDKQMQALAVILTADTLADLYIFKDNVTIDVDWAISNLKSVNASNENLILYQATVDFYYANRNHFSDSYKKITDIDPQYGWIDDERQIVYFYKSTIKDIMYKNNGQSTSFVHYLQSTYPNLFDKDRPDKQFKLSEKSFQRYIPVPLPTEDNEKNGNLPNDLPKNFEKVVTKECPFNKG